ncbi:MAG: PHP domain-containing protein, partial [Bacillota bacterium]
MMSDFVHLHCHSEYSLLDGAARYRAIVGRAAQTGMPAVAITDHGTMFGVIDFYRVAKEAGVKPILGCEVYVSPRSRLDKEVGKDDWQYHLVLLAQNETGYKNLMQLVSAGFLEGFYYKPRVDHELLKKYNQGLIALSACLAGEIPSFILSGQVEKARD